MAVTVTNVTSYRSVATDSTSKTAATISTDTDENRVTSIRITVSVGSSDSSTYDESTKKAVHTAVVNAVKAKIGSGI